MTRQGDAKAEEREGRRRLELVKALEYGLADAIQSQGGVLLGLSIKYGEFDCLLTIRADFEGKRFISYTGSDSMINCFLKAYAEADRVASHWCVDKYHQ